MRSRYLLCLILMLAFQPLLAQVKIGHNAAGHLNPAAILELSNDTAAGAAPEWKAIILPFVNFTSPLVFRDSTSWGISGSPTDGALVYNLGARETNGFRGPGTYVWSRGSWVALQYPASVTAGPSNTDEQVFEVVIQATARSFSDPRLKGKKVISISTDGQSYTREFFTKLPESDSLGSSVLSFRKGQIVTVALGH